MADCGLNISKPKRFIQFNDLVFTGRKSIDEQSESTSLRENKTSRTFAHGSYVANRNETSLIDDNSISLQIALRTDRWDEEHVKAHYEFIIQQLMTPGRLWAINPGQQLVWANCYVTSIQSKKNWVVTDDEYLVFSVDFDNPDGVWYKADEYSTYLEDFDLCDFLAMKANCLGQNRGCCNLPLQCAEVCECCEEKCSEMCDMVDMCSMKNDMQFYDDFFEECNSKWRVVYNCEKAKQEGKELSDMYKHALCDTCINDVFSSSFLSTTTLNSYKYSLALMGKFHNPTIILNGEKLELKGDYNGVITMNYRGEIRYAQSWECIEYNYEEISLSQLNICSSQPYVKPGRNDITVAGAEGAVCVYIDYEGITM